MPLDSTNWPQPVEVIDETTALLIWARGFIERGWCRFVEAQDAAGNEVDPRSRMAVAWCAYGALDAAVDAAGRRELSEPVLNRLEAAIEGEDICEFNNPQQTVEPVLAAFDRAIAAGSANEEPIR